MKAFLGGTCNGSKWRDDLIPLLEIDYFNPVVENWTPECQEEELAERESCDFCLYTLTPESDSLYSIAEVVDDSNKRPHKTVLCVMESPDLEYTDKQRNSLTAVQNMVTRNGGAAFNDLASVARYLNGKPV